MVLLGLDAVHHHVWAGQVRQRLQAPLHLPPRQPAHKGRGGEALQEGGGPGARLPGGALQRQEAGSPQVSLRALSKSFKSLINICFSFFVEWVKILIFLGPSSCFLYKSYFFHVFTHVLCCNHN